MGCFGAGSELRIYTEGGEMEDGSREKVIRDVDRDHSAINKGEYLRCWSANQASLH